MNTLKPSIPTLNITRAKAEELVARLLRDEASDPAALPGDDWQICRIAALCEMLRTMKLEDRRNKRLADKALVQAADQASTDELHAQTGDENQPVDNAAHEPKNLKPCEADNGAGQNNSKGHSRGGAKVHTQAQRQSHSLPEGIKGSLCSACHEGILYPSRPAVRLVIHGSPLFSSTVHEIEQARCRLCGKTARAAVPDNVKNTICGLDHMAASMLVNVHYQLGLPYKRIEWLQKAMSIPLSDATQWDVVQSCDSFTAPLADHLETYAINHASTVRFDDTSASIASLDRHIAREVEAAKAAGKKADDVRAGINTSAFYFETPAGVIVQYYTGRHHAGEVFERLLRQRTSKEPLVKVTDGAHKNFDPALASRLIEGVCNAHARRKFTEQEDLQAAERVKAWYKTVYQNDAYCKEQDYTPQERLDYHVKYSKPVMDELYAWVVDIVTKCLADPRTGFWQGLTFIINQWPRLTTFLKFPGVPLDTNLCEQAIKLIIRYRKASCTFATQNSAEVGDRMMSILATAYRAGADPVAYFKWLLDHHCDIRHHPANYTPWAYLASRSATSAAA